MYEGTDEIARWPFALPGYDNPPTLDLYAQVRAEYDDFFGFGLTHGE